MEKYASLIARILLGHMFILAGISKITGYAGAQGYMQAMGVPGALLPLVILLEIGGGLAVILGFQTRIAALALGLFSIVAALIFHANIADQGQLTNLMKNFTIAGGFLLLAIHGAGPLSLDNRSKK